MVVELAPARLSTSEAKAPDSLPESQSNFQAGFITDKRINFTHQDTSEITSRLKRGENVQIDPIDAYYLSESDEPQPVSGRLVYEREIHLEPEKIVVFDSAEAAA